MISIQGKGVSTGVAIGYDFRRQLFYEGIKDEAISMILVPSASPDDPNKPEQEHKQNDLRASLYNSAFDVPVIYVNSTGALDEYPGKVGDEYFMTKGHFHTILETCEVYYTLSGQGAMLMETPEGTIRYDPATGRR